jgi:hypothetical protein
MIDDDEEYTADEFDTGAGAAVDPDSLSAILGKALSDAAAFGGGDRSVLGKVIGRSAYDRLNSTLAGQKAVDAWLDATPATRPAATRLLALAIAKATGHADMTDRIEKEIGESRWWDDRPSVPPMKAIKAQQRSGQRVSDPLLEAARHSDISQYRRLRLRGQQRQRRNA